MFDLMLIVGNRQREQESIGKEMIYFFLFFKFNL